MRTSIKLRRMMKVLSMSFTIFAQIYWYKLRKKSDEEWEKLWENIGQRFRNTLFELEGLLIKIGQMLSIRSDLLPHAFIRQIEDLTDQVPPSQWGDIQAVLESEWGGTIEEHVRSIDPKAVASASIGEVYKGVLKDGTEVAIKVQRPGIQTIVDTDFRTLKIIMWFAEHVAPIPSSFIDFKKLFQELKSVIERELDFTQEKESLHYFQEKYKEHEFVKIPKVYSELCTAKVLVMEWMNGVKITDEQAVDQLGISRRELAERLIELFLPQWLEPGIFHADPHSGNVLASKSGHIIMLDFGMTGEISKRDAAHFQKLIESLLSKNYAKAVETLGQLDFILPGADPRTMEKVLAEFINVQPSQWQEVDLMKVRMELNDMIRALPIQVPTRFVFLGRSFMTMEGMVLNLVTEEEAGDLLRSAFIAWLKRQGSGNWSFVWYWLQSQPLFKLLHSAADFLEMPQRLERLKEMEQRRQFQFTMYENYKKQCFHLSLLGLLGIGSGIYASNQWIMQAGIGLALISCAGYLLFNHKLKKWMKYMHDWRV